MKNKSKIINFLKEEIQNIIEENFLEEIKTTNVRVNDSFILSSDMGLFKSNERIKVDDIKYSNEGIEISFSNLKGKKDKFYLDKNDEIDFIVEYKRLKQLSNIKEEPEDEIEEPEDLELNKREIPKTNAIEPATFVSPEEVPDPAPEPENQPEQEPSSQEDEPSIIATISRDEAKQLIKNTKGKIFTVSFIKKDGTKRIMNARLGVKAYLKGGELPYNPEAKGLIPVFDMQKREYRMINLKSLLGIKIGKEIYKVQ